MMRLLNIFFPPLPVLLAGKPIQFLINILLCLAFWIPAVIHSWAVTSEQIRKKTIREMKKG